MLSGLLMQQCCANQKVVNQKKKIKKEKKKKITIGLAEEERHVERGAREYEERGNGRKKK